MLQQVQQQDAVEAVVREGKCVGVAPVERRRGNEVRSVLERGRRGVDPARVVTAVEQPARGRSRPAADVEHALRLAQLVPQQHLDQALPPAEPEVRLLQRGQLLGSPGGETHARTGALSVNLRLPSHGPTLTRCPDPTRSSSAIHPFRRCAVAQAHSEIATLPGGEEGLPQPHHHRA